MTPRARFLVGACSLEADVVKKLVGLVVDDDQIANTFAYFRQMLSEKKLEEKNSGRGGDAAARADKTRQG